MTTTQTTRIPANNEVTKRLGNWTTERHFEVRAHRGSATVDLRSSQIPPGDLQLDVDLDHAVLTLLVADDAVIDDWDLKRVDRARLKDAVGPQTTSTEAPELQATETDATGTATTGRRI